MTGQELTRSVIAEMRRCVRRGDFTIHNDWRRAGYEYCFMRSFHKNKWVISGGCREWWSFDDMLRHYDKKTWHKPDRYRGSVPTTKKELRETERQRQIALQIRREMMAAAKRLKLKMAGGIKR